MSDRLQSVDIDSITPYPGNARNGNVELIRESLRENGQYRAVIVQKSSGHIIAGNHTWQAAKAEGWKTLNVEYHDCTDEQARKIVLVDNRANDAAGYNKETLAELLSQLDGDFDGTGFEKRDLDQLLDQLTGDDTPKDETPGFGVTANRAQPGDVWIMGHHRLICGDSTEATVHEELMQGEVVDLIVMDPPYGVDYQGSISDGPEKAAAKRGQETGQLIQNDSGDVEQLVYSALSMVNLKDGGAIYVFAPQGDKYPLIWNAVTMAGITLKQSLVWVKQRFVFGRSDYHYKHELIMYGWKEGAAHYFVDDRTQHSVWEFDNPQSSKEHPTMKPVPMLERAIKNSSERGQIVLDPFGGSGSTLLACESTERHCRIIELDPTYAEVIVSRWESYTGETAIREDLT